VLRLRRDEGKNDQGQVQDYYSSDLFYDSGDGDDSGEDDAGWHAYGSERRAVRSFALQRGV
jgi:hypothetical protein